MLSSKIITPAKRDTTDLRLLITFNNYKMRHPLYMDVRRDGYRKTASCSGYNIM